MTADIVALATAYGRYGYRRTTALLRQAGWAVNAKRVQRIWRREGLKVPQKQPKRGRLWLNDGSCVRLRAEQPNYVWSYDFVEDTIRGRRSGVRPDAGGWIGLRRTRIVHSAAITRRTRSGSDLTRACFMIPARWLSTVRWLMPSSSEMILLGFP